MIETVINYQTCDLDPNDDDFSFLIDLQATDSVVQMVITHVLKVILIYVVNMTFVLLMFKQFNN